VLALAQVVRIKRPLAALGTPAFALGGWHPCLQHRGDIHVGAGLGGAGDILLVSRTGRRQVAQVG
jgi:hypothetical protein